MSKKCIDLGVFALAVLFAGTAMAAPYLDDIIAGQEHILPAGNDLVYLTDLTHPETSLSTLLLEYAAYESGFGIYDPITLNRLQVFDGDAEPAFPLLTQTEVEFDLILGTATITASYKPSLVGTSAYIGTLFGFYLDANASGTIYYTESSLNPDSASHGLIYNTSDANVIVAFEDLPASSWVGLEPDYDDFVVQVTDVSPVPEASTMLLFGSGLSGLMYLARKKRLIKL